MLANTELEKAEKWFNMNQLTLHPSKTKFIVFGNTKDTSLSLLAHAEPIMKELKQLQFTDLYKVNALTTLKKIQFEQGPKILRDFVEWNPSGTRRGKLMKIPPFGQLSQKTTSSTLPSEWNRLFEDTSFADLFEMPPRTFKTNFTDTIIEGYYSTCTEPNCYSCGRSQK